MARPARAVRRRRHPHMIGPLQSNKVKEAVALFDVIQTLDRPRLASAGEEIGAAAGGRGCWMQVNTGEDEKGGDRAGRSRLPPYMSGAGPRDRRPHGHSADGRGRGAARGAAGELARRHGLSVVSVGMSGDFEPAIRSGAMVRVGSAIFGAREKGPASAPPGRP